MVATPRDVMTKRELCSRRPRLGLLCGVYFAPTHRRDMLCHDSFQAQEPRLGRDVSLRWLLDNEEGLSSRRNGN